MKFFKDKNVSSNGLDSTKISNTPTEVKNNNSFIKFFIKIPLDYYFAAFVASFCFSSILTILNLKTSFINLESVLNISLSMFITFILLFFITSLLMCWAFKRLTPIPIILAINSTIFASTLAFFNPLDIYFVIGLAFVLFLVFAWISKKDKMNILKITPPKNSEWVIAIILAIIFIAIVSIASIARYDAYLASNYDLGIFAQMFKNMSTTGLPDTTVERNVLMSHFGVHFSPFFYLILPFYMINPCTETLLVIQATAIASGVFPLILICKKLNLSKLLTIAFSSIYMLFPTLANGALYDFHENKFLTVLILWALYFMISKKTIHFFIFSILTLTVKEDAAIYIITIALFMIIYRKEYKKGSILLALSIVYFIFATSMVTYLNILDEGVMIGRLDNYIVDGGSFGSVIATCFTNIGYVISQIFTVDKIAFMIWIFLPLAFIPFMNKKKSIFILLLPMLVVNLMSDWKYQYDIKYQYTYGVVALVIFMTILTIRKLKKNKKLFATSLSVALCIVCTFSVFLPRAIEYIEIDKNYSSSTDSYDALIATIPKDSSVTANASYIPHMYDIKELYQYPSYLNTYPETDYFLVNANDYASDEDGLSTFMGDNYELIDSASSMQLYKLKE